MRNPDPRPIAIRAYTERPRPPRAHQKKRSLTPRPAPRHVLLLDTETSTDSAQHLLFGSYRQARWLDDGTLPVVEEGLIYADDLPQRDPAALARLQEYVRTHRPDVAFDAAQRLFRHRIWITRRLKLMSQREFLSSVFWRLACRGGALVVGFNLPFDLSRLALHVGQARTPARRSRAQRPTPVTPDEFSFRLFEYVDETGACHDNRYRPRLSIQHLNSTKAFIRLRGRVKVEPSDLWLDEDDPEGEHPTRGRFVDLRTLVHALTDQRHTLKSAAEAFGTTARKQDGVTLGVVTRDTIDYNRQDVRVTLELFVKLHEEFARHDLPLGPWNAYSPASLVKAYLRKMGLRPPREKFRRVFPEIVGPAMSSFYGGRTECRIRRTLVPVVYTDFRSMYPTVNSLMGLWDLVAAESLRLEDVTDEVQHWLDTLTVNDAFDPAFWRKLILFAEIMPDGDIVPVRARYDASPAWNIGINPFTTSQSFWYAGPDLVASRLLTGKAPRIQRAIRLVPVGRQRGLRSIRVRGTTPVDPRTQDFFKTVVEERERLSQDTRRSDGERAQDKRIFKTLGNSGGYGIFAEVNATPTPKSAPATVTVRSRQEPFACETTAPETPGKFCFPPFASITTAAARLMLVLLERSVTERGGTYAFCDTDSMAIVATEQGGLVPCPGGPHRLADGRPAIRALAFEQVQAIQGDFDALNPYDTTLVPGSILKIEEDNFTLDGSQRPLFAYVVAAKRYALYTVDPHGQPVIVRYSEHGLGHLLNPTDPESEDRDWIRQAWDAIVRRALGLPVTDPAWLDRPALTRIAITTPHLLKLFETLNTAATSYQEGFKPFNFGLAAHVHWTDRPPEASAVGFQLVAPYTPDPRRWARLTWIDRYTGKTYRIRTREGGVGVRVKTYRDVLTGFPFHPEAKSLGPDDVPCGKKTTGLLLRRPVRALSVTNIGKEANRLEEREAGLVYNLDEVQADFGAGRDGDEAFRQVLRGIPSTRLAKLSGVSASLIRDIRNGRRRLTNKTRAALEAAVAQYLGT